MNARERLHVRRVFGPWNTWLHRAEDSIPWTLGVNTMLHEQGHYTRPACRYLFSSSLRALLLSFSSAHAVRERAASRRALSTFSVKDFLVAWTMSRMSDGSVARKMCHQ